MEKVFKPLEEVEIGLQFPDLESGYSAMDDGWEVREELSGGKWKCEAVHNIFAIYHPDARFSGTTKTFTTQEILDAYNKEADADFCTQVNSKWFDSLPLGEIIHVYYTDKEIPGTRVVACEIVEKTAEDARTWKSAKPVKFLGDWTKEEASVLRNELGACIFNSEWYPDPVKAYVNNETFGRPWRIFESPYFGLENVPSPDELKEVKIIVEPLSEEHKKRSQAQGAMTEINQITRFWTARPSFDVSAHRRQRGNPLEREDIIRDLEEVKRLAEEGLKKYQE